MSATPVPQAGGPLQPKLTWRQHIARIAFAAVIAIVVLELLHVDVLGWVFHAASHTSVEATPTPAPITSSSPSSGDGLLQAAVNQIVGGGQATTKPNATSTPLAVAPGVAGAASRAGLTAGQAAQLAEADRLINQAGSTNPTSPLANLPSQIAAQEQRQLSATPQPAATTQAVPTLVTPTPAPSQQPVVTNPRAISLLGVTPGQQSGVSPQSVQQMEVAQQAAFIQNDQFASAYTSAELSPARSDNEIWPSDPIDCVLKSTVETGLPGLAIAVVTHDVRSHLPPYSLLIPATTELWGPFNALADDGQHRMQLRWDMMVLPNGATLPLESVQADDTQGQAGLAADVNDHRGRVYTTTLIGTILSVASGIAQARAASVGIPTVPQLFGASAGNAIQNQVNNQIAAAQSIPPTLTVHAGTPFTIHFAAIQQLPPWERIARDFGAPHHP